MYMSPPILSHLIEIDERGRFYQQHVDKLVTMRPSYLSSPPIIAPRFILWQRTQEKLRNAQVNFDDECERCIKSARARSVPRSARALPVKEPPIQTERSGAKIRMHERDGSPRPHIASPRKLRSESVRYHPENGMEVVDHRVYHPYSETRHEDNKAPAL